jgi:hypothetical protein
MNIEDFKLRAESGLLTEPPVGWNRSDDDMNDRARMIPDGVVTKPAAVLVPIILRAGVLMLAKLHYKRHCERRQKKWGSILSL